MATNTAENNKSPEYNTSRSMGNYGTEVLTSTTLDLPSLGLGNQTISSITVLNGTVTVSGKQFAKGDDLLKANLLQPWSNVSLSLGTYITSLKSVVIDASSGTCIVYYG